MQMRHFIEQMWRFPSWACAFETDELQGSTCSVAETRMISCVPLDHAS